MLKKSGMLLSCNNIHHSGTRSKTSPNLMIRFQPQKCRSYAMVSKSHSKHDHDVLRWPETTSANGIPTPYQIFNQKKGSTYSKRRFYELVKLYHPDRHDYVGVDDGLSYATKLERYRLIVAANDILSDPVKRGAYDCYGAGWNGQPDVRRPQDSSHSSDAWGVNTGRGWNGGSQGPSQNATWEDWEKWYQRDANGPQEPTYVSNAAFVSLVVIFAAIGGLTQITRVGNYSIDFMEQRDTLHNNVSKDLIRRRKETTTAFGSREERIDSFLKQRNPLGYGTTDLREDSSERALSAPRAYSSNDFREKNVGVYQIEPPKGR